MAQSLQFRPKKEAIERSRFTASVWSNHIVLGVKCTFRQGFSAASAVQSILFRSRRGPRLLKFAEICVAGTAGLQGEGRRDSYPGPGHASVPAQNHGEKSNDDDNGCGQPNRGEHPQPAPRNHACQLESDEQQGQRIEEAQGAKPNLILFHPDSSMVLEGLKKSPAVVRMR